MFEVQQADDRRPRLQGQGQEGRSDPAGERRAEVQDLFVPAGDEGLLGLSHVEAHQGSVLHSVTRYDDSSAKERLKSVCDGSHAKIDASSAAYEA